MTQGPANDEKDAAPSQQLLANRRGTKDALERFIQELEDQAWPSRA
jgi:hypothetical protein